MNKVDVRLDGKHLSILIIVNQNKARFALLFQPNFLVQIDLFKTRYRYFNDLRSFAQFRLPDMDNGKFVTKRVAGICRWPK